MANRCTVSRGAPRVKHSRGGPADPLQAPREGRKERLGLIPGDLPRHGDDASAHRGHPQVAGGDPCDGQGRIHLPIPRELPREARLPPGAAVGRGRQEQVVAGGGAGGELRLEARGQALVAQHRPFLVEDRTGDPPGQGRPAPSPPPAERRSRGEARRSPRRSRSRRSGIRLRASNGRARTFAPEEVGRRVRDDRLRGRNPENLLVRVPVLGPDPVGVPGGGHPVQLQPDLRTGSGGPAENGDREALHPVREKQLGFPVDLLVEVVGAEGPHGLEESPFPLRREGIEDGMPRIRRAGMGDGDREEQQRRKEDRLHPASRAWALRASRPTGSRSRHATRHCLALPAGGGVPARGKGPVRGARETFLPVSLEVRQRPQHVRDLHAAGAGAAARAAQAAMTIPDLERVPPEGDAVGEREPFSARPQVLLDLGVARHPRDRRAHAGIGEDPGERRLMRAESPRGGRVSPGLGFHRDDADPGVGDRPDRVREPLAQPERAFHRRRDARVGAEVVRHQHRLVEPVLPDGLQDGFLPAVGRDPRRADLPLVDQLRKRLAGPPVGHLGFGADPVELENVDDVHFQGAQAVLRGPDHLVHRGDVDLGRQDHLVPDAGQRPPDDPLVLASHVAVRRVDVVHAPLDGEPDHFRIAGGHRAEPTVPTWNPVFPNGRFSGLPGDGPVAPEAFGGIPGSVAPAATPAAAPIIRRKSLRVVPDRILDSSFRHRRTRMRAAAVKSGSAPGSVA